MKSTPQLFFLGFLSLVLLSSLAEPVSGHAILRNSDPTQNASIDESPPRVTLSFTEALETQSSTLRVLNSAGARVDKSDLVFSTDLETMSIGIEPLPKGVYTVSWQVVSAIDGHPTSGALSFGVQTVVPPPPPVVSTEESLILTLIPEALVRWILFVGQSLMVGSLLFYMLVLVPRLIEFDISSPGNEPIGIKSSRRVLILSMLGSILAIAGTVGLVALQWTGSSTSISLAEFVLGTRLGLVGVIRLGLAGSTALALLYLIRGRTPKRVVLWVSIGLGATVLLMASLSGHNAAASFNPALAVLSDWIHLFGVAAWVGGLSCFALILPILRGEGFHKHLASLVPRFSQVAMASVGAISITGVYSAWLQVGSFIALLNTLYGSTLIVKISLMIPIVLLGALTQLVSHPRMVATLRSVGQTGPMIATLGRRITTSIRTEAALGAILLLTVGLLTAIPPGIQVAQNITQSVFVSKVLTQQAEGDPQHPLQVTLSIFPFRVGANSFEALLKDNQGAPSKNVTQVNFEFRLRGTPSGPSDYAEPEGEGRFLLQGTYLSMPGNWTIEVTVRRPAIAFDVVAMFETELEAYPGLDTAQMVEYPLADSNLFVLDTKVDGSGTVWFTLPGAGSIGRFQPRMNDLEIFPSNYTGSSPNTMAFDSGGNVWFTDALRHSVVSFDPSSEQFHEYRILPTGGQPTGIAFDNSGTAWVVETLFSQLRGFTPQNGSFTPSISTPTGSSRPGPVAVDQQGRVWFAEESTGRIGMLNTTALTIVEYQPDIPASFVTGIDVAPNGDVWFAEHGSQRISRLDPKDGTFRQVPLTNPAGFPWGLKVDSQGNVWFAEHIGDKIGLYDVGSDTFREFSIPTSGAETRNLSIDQLGNVWFGENKAKLGVLALEPNGIGLGQSSPDNLYTLASGITGIGVAAATVVFFILHRKRTRSLTTDKPRTVRDK